MGAEAAAAGASSVAVIATASTVGAGNGSAASGAVLVASGMADAGGSGPVSITTGAAGDSGASGSVILQTGATAGGGSRGAISLLAPVVSVNGVLQLGSTVLTEASLQALLASLAPGAASLSPSPVPSSSPVPLYSVQNVACPPIVASTTTPIAATTAIAVSAAPPVVGGVATLAGTLSSPGYAESSCSTGARFFYPYGVAVGPAGTVFVADSANHVLRTVSTATGATALYAGTPTQSGSSDGDRLTAAKFYYPNRIAVEVLATGGAQLYVSDTQNHLIRAVSADGTVRTVAGQAGVAGHADGTGSSVQFNYPYSLCVDSVGDVYVADSVNHVIRKVTPAGVTTTFAGGVKTAGSTNGQGTAARFATPAGISLDSTGRFFIADVDNNAIRTMTATGLVSTLAGAPGLPRGAIDGVGSVARFYRPFAVAAAPNGDVYVADAGNSLIRRVTPAGAVTTVAGKAGVHGFSNTPGATLFDHPYDLAVDQVTGRVYVCDTQSTLIRVIS